MGKETIAVKAEGGHYTFVDVMTDQIGEAEIDKLAKRFPGRGASAGGAGA